MTDKNLNVKEENLKTAEADSRTGFIDLEVNGVIRKVGVLNRESFVSKKTGNIMYLHYIASWVNNKETRVYFKSDEAKGYDWLNDLFASGKVYLDVELKASGDQITQKANEYYVFTAFTLADGRKALQLVLTTASKTDRSIMLSLMNLYMR